MAAYVIFQGEVLDQEQYDRYRQLSGPAVAAHGGEFLVRGGAVDPLEGGDPPPRTVVIRFESMAAARAWYDSDQYQEARALRLGAADARAYVVDGAD